MVQRVHYRRRCKYNTTSNITRKVKTPGAKLVLQKVQKASKRPKCGDCKRPLSGIKAVRPHLYKNMKKRECTVSRAYGGARCHSCVRDRIIRAFLKEEQKCVKKVVKERKQQSKTREKPTTKKASKPETEKSKGKSERKKSSKKT